MSQTVDELNLAAVDILNSQQITVHSRLFQPSHHEPVLIRGCFSPGRQYDIMDARRPEHFLVGSLQADLKLFSNKNEVFIKICEGH